LCGMNFINLIRIQFIFGIEDQLILSYNPIFSYRDLLLEEKMENRKENGSRNSEDSNNNNVKKAPRHMDNMQ
jgi:hypothetical protein